MEHGKEKKTRLTRITPTKYPTATSKMAYRGMLHTEHTKFTRATKVCLTCIAAKWLIQFIFDIKEKCATCAKASMRGP